MSTFTTPYDRMNTLAEFEMIGGEFRTLYFDVVDENGDPINISTGTTSWVICPYGNPTYVSLTKVGTLVGTTQFKIELETADTESLNGKFIQQAVYTDFNSKEFRKQGTFTILPRIA